MLNWIKLSALLLAFTLSLQTVYAQYDDDIYYSPSAEKKAKEAAIKATMWSTDANDDWDVDGYNRRHSATSTGASSGTASSSLTQLNKSERDTVYIIKENYHYSYADLLFRFHGGFYRPSWYWHTAWGWGDPFYWDRWYNDPFYWDSYYYGGWGWSWGWGGVHVAWHTPIHYHHYGWRPAPHHHHYTPVHRLPAHRVGGHSVIHGGHGGHGGHGYYHSPVIARGGNRHSGIRGGDGSRRHNTPNSNNGSRRGNSGVRGGDGSRRNGNSGSRSGNSSGRYNGSSQSRSGGGGGHFGGGFGGGRSGGGGGHFGGGHSGGGHSGGGGGRGRR